MLVYFSTSLYQGCLGGTQELHRKVHYALDWHINTSVYV